VKFPSRCDCKDPWGAHTGGFHWTTNGGDGLHEIEGRKLMRFDEYQKAAMETVVYPDEIGLAYTALGLAGEAGEIANKVKKVYRDSGGVLDTGRRAAIADEMGDALWYLAALATELGVSLDKVADDNIAKLAQRAEAGVLQGDGDNR
jgi:NTP pyrophosphatase (non-canonical NTP hydrolase)